MSAAPDEQTSPPTEPDAEPLIPLEEPAAPEQEREPDDVDGPPDDETQENEPDAEPEPPAEPAVSQKEIDAVTAKLEKASAAYVTKVGTILGDDISDFKASPLSLPWLFGFVFDPAMVPLDESVVNATKALIGDPVPPPLEQAPDAHECPVCHGWGQIKTGSKVHPYNVAKCAECNGRGWVGERANVTPAQVAAGVTPEALANGHDNEPPELQDSWGTPLGHPDYGKMPQYRDQGWAEALEAYKRGEPAPVV
jgi:hypothetical protein